MSYVNEKYPTRVIIRNLPPNITRTVLLQKLQHTPQFNHFYMENFKFEDGLVKLPRAYINFTCHCDMVYFIQNNDYIEFVAHNGEKYKALIEVAPNQRLRLRRSRKTDHKMGTIELDRTYQCFLEELDKKNTLKYCSTYDFHAKKDEEYKTTPLLKYIFERRNRRDYKGKNECVVFINSAKRTQRNRRCRSPAKKHTIKMTMTA